MNRPARRVRCLLPLVCLALMASVPGALAADPAPLPRAAMDDYLVRLGRFGASGALLVMRDGKVAYEMGFGWADRARRARVSPKTGFDIASMSKQLTAVAILQLEERGLIALGDSLAGYFPAAPADKRGITIEQLLTHRSGLPAYFVAGNDFTRLTRAQACDSILAAPLEFPPGTDEEYSDAGYVLLAILIEQRTGTSLEQFLAREQFRPAGLRHTYSYGTPELRAARHIAHGYVDSRDAGSAATFVAGPDCWVVKGAGGIVSTVGDIARWELALRDGTFLGPRARARFLGVGVDDSTALSGLPERLPGGRLGWIRTGAQDFGFAAGAIRYADDGTIAVVAVNRQPEGMDIAFLRTRLLMTLDGWISGMAPAPPPEGRSDAPANAGMAGRYVLADGSSLDVAADAEGALVVPDGALAVELLAFPADTTGRAGRLALAPRATMLLDSLCAGDPEPLRRSLARPSERIEAYLRKQACGDSTTRHATGTVPHWWGRTISRAPATLMQIDAPSRTTRMRFEWVDGRIGAIGGGGITAPVVRFIATRRPGEFVGYHLGIEAPVTLRWAAAPGERDRLVIPGPAGTAFIARRAEPAARQP